MSRTSDCPGELGMIGVSCDISSPCVEQEIRDLARFPEENPNPILRVSADGVIRYVNRAGQASLAPWGIAVGLALPDDVGTAVADSHEHAQPTELVVECGPRVFSVRMVPIVGTEYSNLYFHDITERRHAELLLQESEERFRLITAHVLDMVSQVSLDGRYLYVSPSHRLVLGYEPDALVGTSAYALVHPDDLEPVRRDLQLAMSHRESRRFEFRYRHADGHYLELEALGGLILDEQGEPRAAVLSARNITERKRLEMDLRRRTEDLERFNRLAVGRELRMIELKQRINDLSLRLGQPPPYPAAADARGVIRQSPTLPFAEPAATSDS